MSAMTFGFGMITAQHHPDDPRSDAELYAEVLHLCELAERLGFDAVWLSEHHFVDDGYMPSLLPVAAAIAARTTRIRIGTGILIAPLHDPLRLAEDAATVDLLSSGRLVLGIGAGYREEEFAGFGRSKERLGAALDQTLAVLRQAWSGEPVQATPDAAPVRVTPRPYRPAGPPLWIGARTAPGIRRVARKADGLMAARVTPEQFGAQVRQLLAEAEKAGRQPAEFEVGVHRPVFAWPEKDAWERLEPYLHYSEWKYRDMVGEPYGRRTTRVTPPPLREETRDILRKEAIVGTPDEVAEAIAAYARNASDVRFHFVPRLYWPGMDAALQREALAVFAEHVIPQFRANRHTNS
ncbi:MAG TPA: LLM class flavin-dependent oxidoreductase [Micromonospora sp.]|mgnify:CR=1 FL=1